ncbi:MAG: ABC transporter permease [Bacteroidales bacterium]|nr:ABC transporter permease [Bacteroidales bacterium]
MKKIGLIIWREFITRVRKPVFIIMTILGPILMALLIVVPIYLAQLSDQPKEVAVVDETGLFYGRFPQLNWLKFSYPAMDVETLKSNLKKSSYDAILYIPTSVINGPANVRLIMKKELGFQVREIIKSVIAYELKSHRLALAGVDKSLLKDIEVSVNIDSYVVRGKNEEMSFSDLRYFIGFLASTLIYIFIIIYGSMVMRGVIEEKSSRIVEILVSSVKPFELMMGKIVGIALVGLMQFVLWIILTFTFVMGIKTIDPSLFTYREPVKLELKNKGLTPEEAQAIQQNIELSQSQLNQILEGIRHIEFGNILGAFLFYFVFGYLLYAAMFAAIGSLVDNETDTQQFVLPITVPLLLGIISINFVLNNPDGPVSFWLSIIPFTSPISMMARIPFTPPVTWWHFILSAVLLILFFILTVWLSGKIYRTGILLYGKKITWREVFKWFLR